MSEAPRLVVTVGLHSSASTWVFNVVRELMAASLGADKVLGVFADDMARLFTDHAMADRHVVLKSHFGGTGWDSLIWLARAPIYVSIRDPRDAAISLALRFKVPLADAVKGVSQDCRCVVRCADAGHPVLRYEDGFFEDSAMPGRIAEQLGLTVGIADQQAIFSRYTTAATRAFAANLALLPADRVEQTEQTTVDRVTQIHRTHIGDGRVGKWRTMMDPQSGANMTRYFEPFLARFGYAP